MAKNRTKQNGDNSPEGDAGEAASAPQAAGDTTAARPDADRVAMRAYELYMARGGGDGQDLEDWLEAEREVHDSKTRREE